MMCTLRTGWIALTISLVTLASSAPLAGQDGATATLEIIPPEADSISEWRNAEFQVVLRQADGTATDVTGSLDLSWDTSCGGSFDGGTFTPPAVNQSGPCEITATFNAGDDVLMTDTVTVNIQVDHCRNGRACGISCGCTPGSAFALITLLGLIALRLLPRPRPGRRA